MRILYIICLVVINSVLYAQTKGAGQICRTEEIHKQKLLNDEGYAEEWKQNEIFIKEFIAQLNKDRTSVSSNYTIPVVLHIFHKGDNGKIDMAQALSGMKVMNDDFNGLNHDFDDIDPAFLARRSRLNINFCLATIDPDGNPTTGVEYYDERHIDWSKNDFFSFAWDNYKYFNIYMPKYAHDSLSDFTAYAYYPNTDASDYNLAGVVYSSIRWGYGSHSQLAEGQEWASINTHESGHYLNLAHTFSNGCSLEGDGVDDTPPTIGGYPEMEGCNNFDFSCGVHTNGENYMDYNVDCKKMFTRGQVDRMTAALHLPSRITLWQPENLIATGCENSSSVKINALENKDIFPNPASSIVNFKFEKIPVQLIVSDITGKKLFYKTVDDWNYQLDVSHYCNGLYYITLSSDNVSKTSKFIKH